MFKFNHKQFFDSYRQAFGPLQQLQVNGLEFLLGKIESDPEWDSLPQLAYFFATIKHETGISRNGVEQTYQPIKELRGRVGTKIRRIQDRYWGTGAYGRGFIQITWPANYAKFGLGKNEYDKALEPETAYDIAARGMRNGMFTKYRLSDFINAKEVDYYNARQTVNGHDDASLIEGHAGKFEHILKSSLVTESVTETPRVEEPKAPEVTTQEPAPPAAVQAPKPEVTPVGKPATSLTTKVAAGTSAVTGLTTFFTAVGLKIGNVEITTGALYGLFAFAAVCVVTGAWLWNESQKRRSEEQRVSMNNLADPNKQNVIAAGTRV